jgi:cytochrome c-type biogenesis protein CcmH/NrfF
MDTFALIAVPVAAAVLGFLFWLPALSRRSDEEKDDVAAASKNESDGKLE